MRQGRLGRTEITVREVGLGAYFIGRSEADDETIVERQAMETVWRALELGVDLIDTAPLYGTERAIAKALAERPDLAGDVLVTTKVGHLPKGFDFSYDMAMRCVEGSMERLGVERFKILYIHDPQSSTIDVVMGPKGTYKALRDLKDQGVVEYIGCASNDPPTSEEYLATGAFDVAVVPEAYSLLNLRAEEKIFPLAEKHDTGLVLATPIEKGLLATGVKGRRARHHNRNFSQRAFDQVAKIEALCDEYGVSLLAAAIQFCLRPEVVGAVIPGCRTPQEIEANVRAADEEIPEAFWGDLRPMLRTLELGVDR